MTSPDITTHTVQDSSDQVNLDDVQKSEDTSWLGGQGRLVVVVVVHFYKQFGVQLRASKLGLENVHPPASVSTDYNAHC